MENLRRLTICWIRDHTRRSQSRISPPQPQISPQKVDGHMQREEPQIRDLETGNEPYKSSLLKVAGFWWCRFLDIFKVWVASISRCSEPKFVSRKGVCKEPLIGSSTSILFDQKYELRALPVEYQKHHRLPKGWVRASSKQVKSF